MQTASNMKSTFIFIKKDICVGGIETFIIRTVRWLLKHNYRVIYIQPKGSLVAKGFKNTIYNSELEVYTIDFDSPFWIHSLKLEFDRNEYIVAYAFDFWYFVFLERMKRKYSGCNINVFYWIPHFKDVFIEDFFPKPLNRLIHPWISNIFRKMENNHSIIYVNKTHLEAFTKQYSYKVEIDHFKMPPTLKYSDPLNEENLIERSKRECFNIITIGRFVFPHKAYIIGLIDSFASLSSKYSNMYLTIIGHGPNSKEVLDKIESYADPIKSHIIFVGEVEYDDLKKYLMKSHLNVGVASTISDGALNSVISIPVRHYCEVCEGYGFLPESKVFTTSSMPGKPIEKYIEEVYHLSEQDFIMYSQKAYNTYANPNHDKNYMEMMKNYNVSSKTIFSRRMILVIQYAYSIGKVLRNKIGFFPKKVI